MNDDVFRKMIGEKLARLRKKARLSQRELGELVGGIGQTSISQFESGQRGIPPDRLEGFAQALGVSVVDLTEDSFKTPKTSREPGDRVASASDVEAWRTKVLMDTSLSEGAHVILALLAADVFLMAPAWMVVVTMEQFIRVTGRSRGYVEKHWYEAISSPYVERVGETEWNFYLRFPS